MKRFLLNILLRDTMQPVTQENETPVETLKRVLEYDKRLDSIASMAETQRAGAGKDLYMIGLANGLILAHATLRGTVPAFVEAENTEAAK